MTEYGTAQDGLSRRQLLRRSAAIGGSLVWAVPAIQSIPSVALAAEGSVAGNGTPSYVFVFYWCDRPTGKVLYVVKYGSSGANPATDQNLSADDGGCRTRYNSLLSDAVGKGYVQSAEAFTGASAVATASSLQVTINDSSAVVGGWLVHDGSCTGSGSKCVSSATPVVNGVAVGPAVPAKGGVFNWQKCKP